MTETAQHTLPPQMKPADIAHREGSGRTSEAPGAVLVPSQTWSTCVRCSLFEGCRYHTAPALHSPRVRGRHLFCASHAQTGGTVGGAEKVIRARVVTGFCTPATRPLIPPIAGQDDQRGACAVDIHFERHVSRMDKFATFALCH
jgi:hypothetical protein